ncbi:hypothetical protein HRJ41_02290 [Pseudomonas sp. BF61]|uniref:hypothetical protein n=1 Tax=Pseudomonas sp. BF61 TaxID=2741068 RepID=UPI001C0B2DEA|nr:hypothetical protein [Pseudomonas sp. BF61]MBU4626305.1 hypothetical protein [Pseudomonas sp. BF61]
MPLLGFLNELSTPTDDSPRELVIEQLVLLARSVQSVRRWRQDFALQTPNPIPSWRFGENYGFGDFLRDARTREEARSLLSAVNRAPLRHGLAMARDADGDLEFRCGEQVTEALGLADLFDGLVLSFSDPRWRQRLLSVERTEVVEMPEGQLELVTTSIEVRNACIPDDVDAHRPWLDTAGKPPFEDFDNFEADRADRFANLDFLGRALDQLRAIEPTHPWWSAICGRLDELQEAMVEWDPTTSPEPQWRSRVTGEHQQRRRLCDFTDLDGETRCFDQHARFTPHAGRLHFRLNPVGPRLIVAHIGLKL